MAAGFTLRQNRGCGWVMTGRGLSLLSRKSGLKDRSNNVKQLGSPMQSVKEVGGKKESEKKGKDLITNICQF